ncbi:cadherin-87A-like [Melanaphis sacchari]|uniref:Protocadherin Fat 4 n=1 Tax=Melanaphis sacchari TaxID=742174 RepID=A0A2H8TKD1_9HEMI|nr:cadherin-87A-like [Melanaphis sacchari]
MVGTRSSLFCLLCTILIFPLSDSNGISNFGGNQHRKNLHELGLRANSDGQIVSGEETEQYPFEKAYYSYKIQSNELLKDVRLEPPIDYVTPEGYSLVLEPIVHFCQRVDKSIIKKFSAIGSKDKVYINVDDDLRNISTNDSTIVYKLKAIKNVNTTVGGSTTLLIRIVEFLPMSDTVLAFEEPSYSLKLAYGHKGKVFKFKTIKTTHKAKEKNTDLEFEKQPENDKYFSKNEYSFKGNYSLEYVPEQLLIRLRISDDGELELLGNIDEGYYIFDVVAVDYSPNSTSILKARSKVHVFIDNIAVCSSGISKFIRAFSKHYITEETKLITVVPGTELSGQCIFSITHQFPFGVGADFFTIDKKTGAVNVKNLIDREAYWFEDMEEPSVYLRLKVHCPPAVDGLSVIRPLHLSDVDQIVYDPTTTLVQLVIVDINDNAPVFADKHIVVGYPVQDVANTIIPKHLLQAKATDKDAGKHGKIQYSLRGDNANDFIINADTGTIYCMSLVNDSTANKTFEVVAKDNDGKSDGSESTMAITVKFLTFSEIVRVSVQFSSTEDPAAVESQLSEISGVKVMSLTNDVINTFMDGQWHTERVLTVYGVNNTDGSVVSASELQKNLEHNAKVLGVMQLYNTNSDNETSTVMSLVYAAMFFLMLSMVAVGLLYFGYVKNGRYLSCISSPSTTPLKDDIENMSQSNWITTFNRTNLTSNRVRFPGDINSEAVPCRSKITNNATVVVENSLYEAIPPKGTAVLAVNNNSSIVKLDSKVSFEDDLIKLEKMDEVFTPTDELSFNY